MGQRSRKRRGATAADRRPATSAADTDTRAPANGRRESGRGDRMSPEDATGGDRMAAGDADGGRDRMARGYARSRERDEAVRAALQPLAPGERPRAVTVAAILAAMLALANVALLAAGWEVRGGDDSSRTETVAGTVLFACLLLAAGIGMWRCRYWAVLGFEALLGIAIAFAALSLLVASNIAAVLLCIGIIAVAGPLFWFLIRAMARIQLPERRPREPVG